MIEWSLGERGGGRANALIADIGPGWVAGRRAASVSPLFDCLGGTMRGMSAIRILLAVTISAVVAAAWGPAFAAGPFLASTTNVFDRPGCLALDNQPGSRN